GVLISALGRAVRKGLPRQIESVAARYGAVVAMVGVAILLKRTIFPNISRETPFVLFYAVVTASTWLGGAGPGLLAIVLSILVARLVFLGPPASGALHDAPAIFGLEATLLCLLTATYRAAIVASETHMRRIFHEAPVPMMVTDPGLRIRRANPAVATLLGREQRALQGTDLGSLVHPISRDRVLATLGGLFTGQP